MDSSDEQNIFNILMLHRSDLGDAPGSKLDGDVGCDEPKLVG